MKYKYSEDWFTHEPFEGYNLEIDSKKETHVLEIGSYEGRSAVYFAETYLEHPESSLTLIDPCERGTKETLFENMKETGKDSQINIFVDKSENILPRLKLNGNRFDLIYVDGAHNAVAVLKDAVMAFEVLCANGYMVFDDYEWELRRPDIETPKLAINSFLEVYRDNIELIYKKYRVVIRKLLD